MEEGEFLDFLENTFPTHHTSFKFLIVLYLVMVHLYEDLSAIRLLRAFWQNE